MVDESKLNFDRLSFNPAAIHLLEKHPEKIEWCCLSANSAAIHLLEANPEKSTGIGYHEIPRYSNSCRSQTFVYVCNYFLIYVRVRRDTCREM